MAAIVAAAIAALELFVLVIVGISFATKLLSNEAGRAASVGAEAPAADEAASAGAGARAQAAGEAAPLLPRGDTSVLVLNGNGVRGAAAIAAEQVRGLRYLIAGTGNAPRTDFRRSLVMYRPGREGEAARLAQDLKVKRVAPLDGMRLRDLQGAHLAFIVGG